MFSLAWSGPRPWKGRPLRKGPSMLQAPPRAAGVVELKNHRAGQNCLLLRWTSDWFPSLWTWAVLGGVEKIHTRPARTENVCCALIPSRKGQTN